MKPCKQCVEECVKVIQTSPDFPPNWIMMTVHGFRELAADALRASARDDHERVPVQGEGKSVPAGTVEWWEHLLAWKGYNAKFPGQSAERIVQRCGFSRTELTDFLGHEPTTWEPVKP